METDWAENRAKIPQDPIRNFLGKYADQVYSSGERDKFRTRLERSGDGGTEIFISHRGMVEQLIVRPGGQSTDTTTVWQPRPPDPELEAEFLRRLMVKLGTEDARAKAQLSTPGGQREQRAKLVDGASQLNVNEPFDRAWRRVGLALDRVGFTVEDRDRSKGVYFVRYVDPASDGGTKSNQGFLAKLAFWRSNDEPAKAAQYQVMVKGAAAETQVQVLNKDGRPDTTAASKKILSLLYDQLK
jgi:outer membrane protein assembly factor BamC